MGFSTKNENIQRRMVELKNYIFSLVHFYGIVSVDDVVELYNQHHGVLLEWDDVSAMDVDHELVVRDGDFFVYRNLFREKSWYSAIFKAQRNMPRYEISKEVLRQYESPEFIDRTDQFVELVECLEDFGFEDVKAEEYASYITRLVIASREEEMIYGFLDSRGLPYNDQTFGVYLSEVMNNSRLWINFGHTMAELQQS